MVYELHPDLKFNPYFKIQRSQLENFEFFIKQKNVHKVVATCDIQ